MLQWIRLLQDSFRNEWSSIITTFVMTLGEINKSDLLDTGVSLYPFEGIANILLVIFLFLMPMVLINLTVSIAPPDLRTTACLTAFSKYLDSLLSRITQPF